MIKSTQMQRPKLVLVVDDQEINRDSLEIILEDDYEIIYAENGKEAIDQMRGHANELSLVLLDLMMPVMNRPGGRAVKAHPHHCAHRREERRAPGPADGRGGFHHQAL